MAMKMRVSFSVVVPAEKKDSLDEVAASIKATIKALNPVDVSFFTSTEFRYSEIADVKL